MLNAAARVVTGTRMFDRGLGQIQGSYRHWNAFFQDFPGLAKTKLQGFPGLKNPFFQDFPGHVPFTNVGRMRPKKCIYKISYQCICITVKKCNTCGYIIVLQWTQISPASLRGGNVLHVIAYCLATTQTRTNNSRTAGLQFQDFPGFSRTYAFSRAWNSEQ